MIEISIDATQWKRLQEMYAKAGKKSPTALMRALNRAGQKAKTKMKRALVPQTGLKSGTINRALKSKNAFSGGNFVIHSEGGNIRVRFFKPKESGSGVIAHPWNRATFYQGAFTKAGGRRKRGSGGKYTGGRKVVFGGEVKQRVGKSRLPLKTLKSGVFIPTEMVTKQSAGAFYDTAGRELPVELLRQLQFILGKL
jgi:hypothetical protein